MEAVFSNTKERMTKTINALNAEYATIRAGEQTLQFLTKSR